MSASPREMIPLNATLASLERLKRERGLLGYLGPLASFTVPLSAAAVGRLERLSAGLVEALMKVAYQVLLATPGFPSLAELGFTRPMRGLLQARRPADYRELLVIGRLDVSTDGQQHVSYELNGSQPGGMEYLELFAHPELALLSSPGARAGEGRGEVLPSQFEVLYRCYAEAALERYAAERGREAPRGILLLGHGYHLLEVQHRALARQLGRKIFVAPDGRDCELEGNELFWRNAKGRRHRVDLVFRSPRASFEALLRRENTALRRAWRQGALTVVNPPHSKLVGWKPLAVCLGEERLLDLAGVSAAERTAIAALVPTTERVVPGQLSRFEEARCDWVLKGPRAGRGKLVWLGAETSAAQWREQLAYAAGQPGWICQRMQPPYSLRLRLHDEADTAIVAPASVDPYVVVGSRTRVPSFLCRGVIPATADPAEVANVKLNLLGANRYTDSAGVLRQRQIGFGFVAPGDECQGSCSRKRHAAW